MKQKYVIKLKMLAIILLTNLQATTFLSNLLMSRYWVLRNTRWTCFSPKYNKNRHWSIPSGNTEVWEVFLFLKVLSRTLPFALSASIRRDLDRVAHDGRSRRERELQRRVPRPRPVLAQRHPQVREDLRQDLRQHRRSPDHQGKDVYSARSPHVSVRWVKERGNCVRFALTFGGNCNFRKAGALCTR